MPIADLLGVKFDMQLLWRLSLTAAVVLLVSWAYRFYSSREERRDKLSGKKYKDAQNNAYLNSKRTPQDQSFKEDEEDDEGEKDSAPVCGTSDNKKKVPAEAAPRNIEIHKEISITYRTDDKKCMKTEILHPDQQLESKSSISSGCALSPSDSAESHKADTSGRRSPCFLNKLEGSVGVGRELRQDLEHQGVYSSFFSKAEIKVENANLVLEGPQERIVRGKIYDYYVETSSRSTDSKSLPVNCGRHTESKHDFGIHNNGLLESPSSVSPIVMRDLILPQKAADEDSSKESLKLRHPAKPTLLRKESYLTAAEQSELSALNSRPSTQMPHPQGSLHDNTGCNQSPTNSKSWKVENAEVETIAGVPFFHLTAETFLGTDFETLKRKLDLGNCLEILYLAKNKGHKSLQQAALRVMSDNYLQVLRNQNLYGRLMANEREQIRKERTRGKKFVVVADLDPRGWLGCTEGNGTADQVSESSAMYCYDEHKDTWHAVSLLPQEVISKACAMCTMDNYLFVAVGCERKETEMTPSKRVFCYNPMTCIWKEISPMNAARPRCKLAALEGCVYAIGGECLSSVERYDPRQDRWEFVAPLPNDTFAVAHHVTVCSGELFVSGGTLRYMLLRYNPTTNTWRPSLIVGTKDRSTDMVGVGRFLYRFDINPLLGVNVYRYHTVARLWYECSSKRLLRCPTFQCVAVDDRVYCVSRHFTMRFEADEISPTFADEDLSVLTAAKGILFPFVLSLPDKDPQQTSV